MDFVDYGLKFIAQNYVWGGNTPEQGFDCSGFVCECLKFDGIIPNNRDLNSQAIHYYLKYIKTVTVISSKPKRGTILFFGKSINEITHIGIAIDKTHVLESSGEGKTSTDKGFVRIRPIDHRNDLIDCLEIL